MYARNLSAEKQTPSKRRRYRREAVDLLLRRKIVASGLIAVHQDVLRHCKPPSGCAGDNGAVVISLAAALQPNENVQVPSWCQIALDDFVFNLEGDDLDSLPLPPVLAKETDTKAG